MRLSRCSTKSGESPPFASGIMTLLATEERDGTCGAPDDDNDAIGFASHCTSAPPAPKLLHLCPIKRPCKTPEIYQETKERVTNGMERDGMDEQGCLVQAKSANPSAC